MSTKMEQPFYHDDSFLSAAYGHSDSTMLKQNLSLTLAEPCYRGLKAELFHQGTQQQELGSLKLASPELERLIIQSSVGGGVITTPTPGPYFYSRSITDEQEGFAEGFVKALDELHKINQLQVPPPPNISLGGGAAGGGVPPPSGVFGSSSLGEPPIYTTLSAYCPSNTSLLSSASSYPTTTISYLPQSQHHHQTTTARSTHLFQQHPGSALHHLKEEPQTVPDLLSDAACSPPISPIDMENQERIKAERKRLRNRVAATKCRKRKLDRISRLEDKVKVLKTDNAGLSSAASLLRDQVAQLKHKVLTHVSSGCQLMLTSKMEAF